MRDGTLIVFLSRLISTVRPGNPELTGCRAPRMGGEKRPSAVYHLQVTLRLKLRQSEYFYVCLIPQLLRALHPGIFEQPVYIIVFFNNLLMLMILYRMLAGYTY